MDFKDYLERSWKLTLQYIVPLIISTLVMAVASFITFGILFPALYAGYMQSVLLMIRSGREPKIQDLFSELKLFLPLIGFGIVVFIVLLIGFSLFVLPGILLSFALVFGCLYMLPLMTDQQMDIISALKESFSIVTDRDKMLDHFVVALLVMGISTIGGSVFIGWLFTQPLATVLLMLVYEQEVRHAPVTVMEDDENLKQK